MVKMIKSIMAITLICIFVIGIEFFSYAYGKKAQEDINETLVLLNIIEDNSKLFEPVTRAEFSKFISKASKNKDKIPNYLSENVCNDVAFNAPYAAYIKNAIENGYMFTYLGGLFKPSEYVTYNDLTRACLSLLSYTNDDFRGNQIIGRNMKFNSLGLNERIDKDANEVLTKQDIVNGIYNTLKESIKDTNDVYGLTIFDKLVLGTNKELDAFDYRKKNVKGPFFAKNAEDIDSGFVYNDNNVYLNGVLSNISDVKYDIVNYGYAIYYLDLDNNILYAYTERQDVAAPIMLRRGYIYKAYYTASNLTVPYRVDIDNYKYLIDSEEMKFAFSSSGSFREEQEIIYLFNKMNDTNKSYVDSNGKVIRSSDETEIYNGSIIAAYSVELIK